VPRAELACGRVGDDGDVMAAQPVRPTLRLLWVRQDCGLELASSGSPCPRGAADGPASRGAQRAGTSESQRSAPRQTDPREGRRSGRRPPASFMMAPTVPTLTPCRGADRGGSRRTRRPRRARRRRRSQALPRGACSHCLSGAAESRTFTCPSSPAGATVQPPAVAEAKGSAPPQRARERVAAVKAADRSRVAPELAGSKRAALEQAHWTAQ
jgi:hypothetical protein